MGEANLEFTSRASCDASYLQADFGIHQSMDGSVKYDRLDGLTIFKKS